MIDLLKRFHINNKKQQDSKRFGCRMKKTNKSNATISDECHY